MFTRMTRNALILSGGRGLRPDWLWVRLALAEYTLARRATGYSAGYYYYYYKARIPPSAQLQYRSRRCLSTLPRLQRIVSCGFTQGPGGAQAPHSAPQTPAVFKGTYF